MATNRNLTIANQRHPHRARWLEDEARTRASFLAIRRRLAPFLVPHRFEGKTTKPEELPRALYGYGIGLNAAYLAEIIGHIAGAPVEYRWGPLTTGKEPLTEAPTAGVAADLWRDATRDGCSWPRFFASTVLEWMLSSVGGWVLVDVPSVPARSRADERQAQKRPYFRWVPWSAVEDFGEGWIQLAETRNERRPGETRANKGLVRYHVLYELVDGTSVATRYDDTGTIIQRAAMGQLLDRNGQPTLPLVPVTYGEHPDLDFLGSGLLLSLCDIVIDLFNLVSETREGFRDACFGINAHTGPDGEKVRDQLAEGSRFITLGDVSSAKLERIAGDPAEAQTGLELIGSAIAAWALAAKRNAKEAQETSQARSGLSLVAEFQLDMRPLLVSVAQRLDDVESNAMLIAAQMAGETTDPATVGVKRGTDFRLEDEASRISRIVGEFTRSLDLPAEAIVQVTMRWLESSGILGDLEAATEGGGAGKPQTVRRRLEQQVRELADAKQRQRVRETEFIVPPAIAA